jgi:hypothetical protein
MEKAISKLNPVELEAILQWIDAYVLSRPSKKLCRDFSDGVLLAEILKFEFPKLVELHNYAPCSGINGKVENWSTLNRKVLKKLGVQLKREEIEKLARAETTFVEEVLFIVMNTIKQAKALEKDAQRRGGGDGSSVQSDIMTINVSKRVGDRIEHVPKQVISYELYEELQSKYDEQQLYVNELKETIADLQNASEARSKIIEDLESRIEKRRSRSIKESLASFF